ncbi:MAG: hypothetical protein AAFP90_22255 [Planctomycetota bacterium]
MKNLNCLAATLVALVFLVPEANAQTQLEDKLKNALRRYPAADTNKDGVLSIEEAKVFRAKMRAGKVQSSLAEQPIDTASYKQPANLKDGARCLFLGHSFFIPVARKFDEFAVATGLPNHHASFVMNGGGGGAPGRIWNSKSHRAAATRILETGNVHLLGMTYFDESNCRVEDYERWIDLAVKHNSKVRIFIGLCWPDSPEASMGEFDRILRVSNDRLFKTVRTLRSRYPNTQIQFVNYGQVARELKARHSAGRSSEIKSLVSRSPDALFRDPKGHAGPLLLDVAALTWLQHLYGVEMERVKAVAIESEAARAILPVVAKFNEQFQSAN